MMYPKLPWDVIPALAQPDCFLKVLRLSKKIAQIDLSDKEVCHAYGRLLTDLQLEGIQLQLEVIP
jgi:hypothetical protein